MITTETTSAEIEAVYDKARRAQLPWSQLPVKERVRYLHELQASVLEQRDSLCQVVSKDTGKPKLECLVTEVAPILDTIKYMQRNACSILNAHRVPTPPLLYGRRSSIEYMPRGVVLVISPWNYPLQLTVIPMISALVAGNTVIVKPSEVAGGVHQLIRQLFQHFPPDVVQVVLGDGNLGAALVDGGPDHIFFTGSIATGKAIQAQAARQLIPTTLELGGKDPMIVFADANMERAVQGALWGSLTNCGQVCLSTERLYVEEAIYSTFMQKLVHEAKRLTQGSHSDCDLGTLTLPQQAHTLKEQILEALSQGAQICLGPTLDDLWKDQLSFPIILTGVTHNMKIMQEETFGPVLPIMSFTNTEEAIALANDAIYGLGASVWSSDLARANYVASRLICGNVMINDVLVSIANPHLPFGGTKQSGLGRYHSAAGLRTFCHEKAVMVSSGKYPKELYWYPYKGKYPWFSQLIAGFYSRPRKLLTALRSFMALQRETRK
ncbi:MAG: aldehyde dehydrogenase family protein [Limnochordia bacterium]|nr:aldehyde dehydrogenase family protein [Limnochordia bacterium]